MTYDRQLLNILMEQAPLGICLMDRELRFLCINDKLAEINGIPAHEHIGKQIHEIVPTLMPAVQQVVNELLLTGQPVVDREFCGETALRPGVMRYWSESWYPVLDDTAKIIAFVVIVSEVTERKLAEKEIREREKWLVGVNQILHAALTSETEGEIGLICLKVIKRITKSPIGFIGEVNGAVIQNIAISNTGWEACRNLGHSGHPLASFKIHGIYGRVISEGKSLFTNDPTRHPDSIGLPENHPPLSSFLGVPLMHEKRVFGILAVGNRTGGYTQSDQDLLEGFAPTVVEAFMRKRANVELKALNTELEQRVEERTRELQESQAQYLHAEKLSTIGRLSASIAHEFNNPLQGIMTILQGLKKTEVLKDVDKTLLNLALGESIRMRDLIRSLQEFNRPSSGKKELMDIHATIDSLMLFYKSEFQSKNIRVEMKQAPRLPNISAVPDQIKQVFLNLLNNAVDACHPHCGVITISTWRDQERIAVAIKDTGVGIEQDNIDRIFQPFYSTKPAVKGTGLGLSVCHGIVQNHGGEIRVESKPGEGSTFTVFLPINDVA